MAAGSPTPQPDILDPSEFPTEGSVRRILPGEDLAGESAEAFDHVIIDHSLAFESDPLKRLREARHLLKPTGQLILAEVFRKRGLPTDLLRQRLLRETGLASAILLADIEGLLSESGFQLLALRPAPIGIEPWIARLDERRPISVEVPRAIGEEEWIASAQACCGLGGTSSEKLSELLRCDDVQSLWTTRIVLARRI